MVEPTKEADAILYYKYKTKHRVFKPEEIVNYSVKISEICKKIKTAKGIVLVYSEFIEGGVLPLALALEEMGISRYSSYGNGQFNRSLLYKPPTP